MQNSHDDRLLQAERSLFRERWLLYPLQCISHGYLNLQRTKKRAACSKVCSHSLGFAHSSCDAVLSYYNEWLSWSEKVRDQWVELLKDRMSAFGLTWTWMSPLSLSRLPQNAFLVSVSGNPDEERQNWENISSVHQIQWAKQLDNIYCQRSLK